MRPHVEIFFAKSLKISRVIPIFVRLTKIQKRLKKKQERVLFGHFWIDTKKRVILFKFSNQAKILWVFKNGIFRFHLLYQLIDTLNFFLGFCNFFEGLKGGSPKKFWHFLLLSHDNRLTWIYSLIRWLFLSKFNEEDARRRFWPHPPWIGLKKLFSALRTSV